MNKNVIILLRLIKARSDIGFLTKQGLTYSQISQLFAEALRGKLLIQKIDPEGRQRFILTDEGEALSSTRERIASGINSSTRWISPDQSHWCEKIEIDDIFMPSVRDSFLLAP